MVFYPAEITGWFGRSNETKNVANFFNQLSDPDRRHGNPGIMTSHHLRSENLITRLLLREKCFFSFQPSSNDRWEFLWN